jgi:hypothetical protein
MPAEHDAERPGRKAARPAAPAQGFGMRSVALIIALPLRA